MSAVTALGRGRSVRDAHPAYSEPSRFVTGLFLFYVLYLYLQLGVRFAAFDAIRLEFVLGAILGPIALVRFIKQPRAKTPVLRWSVLLLLCMAVMVIFSEFPAESWDIYWNRGIKFAVYGLCIAAFVRSPRILWFFIGTFLLAFLKMGQEGFLGTLTGSLIWENQEIPRLHGATPSYAHPNSFSGTQLGVLPYLYYLYPLIPWYGRALFALQAVFCGNVVLRTGSRTGYLGFLTAVAAVLWDAKKKFRALALAAMAAMVLAPLIPADYVARFTSIFEDESKAGEDTSVGKRKEILVDAMQIFAEHPLGIGVGAFPYVRMEKFGREQDTHNLYLEVATNLGVQGLVVFSGFILALTLTLRRLAAGFEEQIARLGKPDGTDEARRKHLADLKLMRGCALATWVFLLIRLMLGAFGMDMYEIYWWFAVGLTIALANLNETARLKTQRLTAATPS